MIFLVLFWLKCKCDLTRLQFKILVSRDIETVNIDSLSWRIVQSTPWHFFNSIYGK